MVFASINAAVMAGCGNQLPRVPRLAEVFGDVV